MNKMKKLIIVLMIFGFGQTGLGQAIENFSIDSGGESVTADGINLIYTLGEVNVQERSTGNIHISEGFINGVLGNTLDVTLLNPNNDGVLVYPNPANDVINILTTLEIGRVQIFDVTGKEIWSQFTSNSIRVVTFPTGVYLLRLESGSGVISKRIIIN